MIAENRVNYEGDHYICIISSELRNLVRMMMITECWMFHKIVIFLKEETLNNNHY